MKNYKIVLPLYFLSIVCLILFSSCSEDNPIIHSNDPIIVDSNYFDWKFDTIQIMPSRGMYIADTNIIFIPGNHFITYINNGSIRYISYNDNDFAGWCIAGTSTNNVYIGGSSISLNRSKLKKWNGTNIDDIEMPIDTTNYLGRIVMISENELWISTLKNTIYHYLNNSFTTYKLDSNLEAGLIYKDNIGNIFVSFVKFYHGLNAHLIVMLKFDNNSWVEVCRDSVSVNSEIQDFIGFSDNKMLRSGKTGIYYFTGNIWEKYINTVNNLRPYIGSGKSDVNILFQADENNQSYVFYYDGKQFYRNSNLIFPYLGFEGMQYKYGRYYVSIGEDWMGKSYFGTAKFK